MAGELDLRSGTWVWQSFELREGGGGPVDLTYIALRRKDSPTSRMTLRWVGASTGDLAEDLRLLAKHPWERELVDHDGTRLRFFVTSRPAVAQAVDRNDRPETYSVLFHSPAGHGVGEVPFEVGLGWATDEELLEVVRAWQLRIGRMRDVHASGPWWAAELERPVDSLADVE